VKQQIRRVFAALKAFIEDGKHENTPVLTAYVGVDSTDQNNRRDRPAWLIELKNEAKRIEEEHGGEALKRRDTQRTWEDTEAAIMAHLEGSKAQGRSIVVFTDHEDFLALDLPVPLATKLYYGTPQVKPLLFALDCNKKVLVVLFSETETRFLEVFLVAPGESARVQMGPSGGVSLRPGGRTSRTQASDRRDLDSERRVVEEAADEVDARFLADSEIEHLVFGGNLKLAHAVRNALHPTVYSSIVTIEPIAFGSTDNQVADAARKIADERELEHDLALVNELVSRRHACGTAVLETQGVLHALQQGQASKLVVALPIPTDKFDDLLIKCVLSGCEIEFLHGEAAEKLHQYGGVAALLHYSGVWGDGPSHDYARAVADN
jgi:hypothetical protein